MKRLCLNSNLTIIRKEKCFSNIIACSLEPRMVFSSSAARRVGNKFARFHFLFETNPVITDSIIRRFESDSCEGGREGEPVMGPNRLNRAYCCDRRKPRHVHLHDLIL